MGNSPAVQWLGLCAFTAEGPGSDPGWGTKIPQASQHGQKKKAFLGEIVKYCIIKYRILF